MTVALGSTLATVLLSKDVALAEGVLALGILISLQCILASLSVRSKKISQLISSGPTLIFYKGSFLESALRKERVTEAKVRSILRSSGVTSTNQIEAVVI